MLRRILESESELEIVGEAAKAESLLAQIRATHPDLVLLDWDLPGRQATGLMGTLQGLQLPPKVVAFSWHREACQEAFAAGALAFASREDPLVRLLTTVRMIGGLSPYLVV